MASTAAELDLCWAPRDLEAQLLAGLLRLSRVSVLYGAPGAGKTTLLFTGVIPLLQRRAEDCCFTSNGRAPGAKRFPERRRNIDSPAPELAIFFRGWNDRPLTALREQIRAALPVEPEKTYPTRALAEDLAAWSKEFGVRFLIILDEFEQYLTAPPDDQSIEEFANEFSDAVTQSQLPANFLISLRDDAQPVLERFRAHIPGLDNSSFRLPAIDPPRSGRTDTTSVPIHTPAADTVSALMGSAKVDVVSNEHLAPASAASVTPTAPLATSHEIVTPSADDGVIAAFDSSAPTVMERLQGSTAHVERPRASSSLTKLESDVLRFDEPLAAGVTAVPNVEHATSAIGDTSVDERRPEPLNAASRDSNGLARMNKQRLKSLAIASVCATLLLILWTTITKRSDGDRVETTAQNSTQQSTSTSMPGAAASGLPRIALAMDADNTTDMHIARDFGRVIAPDAGLELVLQPGALLFSNDTVARIALMRYEFLQILRTIKDPAVAALDGLRVIMPLYTEEIYFIARRDSPLAYIHQVEGTRINVGLERSSRRLTVARLYDAMFGSPVPMANVSFLGDDEALKRLVDDGTVDVVVVVGAQPTQSLMNLPARISSSIKLLKVDPKHAAGRRAIEVFLPTLVRAANYGAWLREDTPTLATMAFLVSTGEANPEAASRLEMLAHSLCRTLPDLRRNGHPKWREVQPGFEVDAGWPYSSFAKTAFQSCQKPQNPAAASVVRR